MVLLHEAEVGGEAGVGVGGELRSREDFYVAAFEGGEQGPRQSFERGVVRGVDGNDEASGRGQGEGRGDAR